MHTTALVAAVAVSLVVQTVHAAPGDLDPTFGSGGKVFATPPISWDGPYALALQSDGKLVSAGRTGDTFPKFTLARHNGDGTLDATFGTGGTVTTDVNPLEGRPEQALAVAVQADGKIVAAGGTWFDVGQIALVRYDDAGNLDATFGSGGIVTTAVATTSGANAVVLQPDGKIVVAGSANIIPLPSGDVDRDFALVRYNADGSLDATFGTGGKVLTGFGTVGDSARALALQPDGKLVAAGHTHEDIALARYNADGSLDSTFGTGGKIVTRVGMLYRANALAIQPDGKVVIAGDNPSSDNGHIAVVRYGPDGTLDPSFGNGGIVKTSLPEFPGEGANGLVVQPDGKLLVAGLSSRFGNFSGSGDDFLLARYNPDGTLDGSFGTNGRLTTAFGSEPGGGTDDRAFAVLLQPDGRVVAGGAGDGDSLALARYETAEVPAQTIRGTSFNVRDPQPGIDPSLRKIVVVGKELASLETVGANPLANGATVEIFADGANPTSQVFALPAGASVSGSPGWKVLGAAPVLGYSYKDVLGANGPVQTLVIKKATNGTFTLKTTIKGKLGPGPQPHLTVVPPAPGTAGRMRFTITGGSTYCVNFGDGAGGVVSNTPATGQNVSFKVVRTTAEGSCP